MLRLGRRLERTADDGKLEEREAGGESPPSPVKFEAEKEKLCCELLAFPATPAPLVVIIKGCGEDCCSIDPSGGFVNRVSKSSSLRSSDSSVVLLWMLLLLLLLLEGEWP